MKDNNGLVTKGDLTKALTKTEAKLQRALQKTEEKLQSEITSAVGNLQRDLRKTEEKLHNEVAGFKDEVMTRLDAVMGELQTIREEQTVHYGVHEDIKIRFQTLEKNACTR